MHSVTKYLGGHSDLMGGALVVADEDLFDELYFVQNATGGIMGPMEAFLSSRGLKTLELRMREQSRSTAHIAQLSRRAWESRPRELPRSPVARGTRHCGATDDRHVRRDAQF